MTHQNLNFTYETINNSVCNVTITAEDVISLSGHSFGEIKSSPGMKGPVFCWFRYTVTNSQSKSHDVDQFRFVPLLNQRVELHIYRILGVGQYDSKRER